ncbi:16S rRNA (adenine(1518)-N(6)/adenine(1519)-N(6))-dimethyltransferase RsmA [Fulvivirga sp. M361]|uniref:16S rRNA (adenine(1518)-N(6)/adenine(1519)-N(6))- dimethyltransferase RsmA n=1 Tax=Fulvivirga sp. M361 TaxID=2594266 RepID=UPI00117BC914|nr:16S rRNA (adenine(1518)-N(6)/adenine(1519)-N(6))-dimethyltransferase RsmA [Fulvivirga sp. M361]TRX61782.1 16S rRNA (adenine(1518)-N(6)/adenine(1519)-N(6))-dimethyltransferase RsmA [Fulvivirga sp. M361]
MVQAKKHLGQHFLRDHQIAREIVQALDLDENDVLEIGPGTGILSDHLLKREGHRVFLMDVDHESIEYLRQKYASNTSRIIEADFLKTDLTFLSDQFKIIGNLPYNISSQIFFRVIELKDQVSEIVCMLQKEVAERLASPPGSKAYGILSVLLQAYYTIDYLFTVGPEVFQPPPKVHSGVIRLVRNDTTHLECDEKLFKTVVKQGFQNRRKTLRNALKPLNLPIEITRMELLDRRAETLSVEDFVGLTKLIEKWSN